MKQLEVLNKILNRCETHTEERFRLRLTEPALEILMRVLEDRCIQIEYAQELGGAEGIAWLRKSIPNLSAAEAKEMIG